MLIKAKAVFQIIIIIFSIFILVDFTNAEQQACCEKTVSGDFCLNSFESQCDSNYNKAVNQDCSTTQFCGNVCCISKIEGSCSKNVAFSTCINNANNRADPKANCEISDCNQGCCQIGNNFFLDTKNGCNYKSRNYPLLNGVDNFDKSISDEYICLNLARQQEEGCCVNNGQCSFTTKQNCETADSLATDGSEGFYSNILCSSSSLSCSCVSHQGKQCFDDAVHWVDSCGNKEEKVQDCNQDEICETDSSGQAYCGSLNCEDTQDYSNNVHDPKMGGERLNGESWCVYEGPTGEFRDYPGTRQYRHYCVNGKEYSEPCREYREEICLQGSFTSASGGPESSARCIQNNYVPKSNSAIATNISTVPLGQKFWESYNPEDKDAPLRDSEEICKKGNFKCKVTYARSSYLGDWECKANCDCEKQETINQAALYCKSQGDCGADLNIEQEMSVTGIKIKWKGSAPGPEPRTLPNKFWEELKEYGVFGGMQRLVEAYNKLLTQQISEGSGYSLGGRLSLSKYTDFAKDLIKTIGPAGLYLAFFSTFVRFIFGKYFDNLIGTGAKTKTLNIKCNPYVPPLGGSNCEKCTEDKLHPCTEYKCRSLGTSCQIVNEGTDKAECVDINPNDVNSPLITPWQETLSEGYEIKETGVGYSITPEVNPFKTLTFGIKTDEPAMCNYDLKHTDNFDDMENDFTYYFAKEHNISVGLVGDKNYRYFVRCQDNQGNTNINEYEISFRTSKEPDLTPPFIMQTSLPNNAPISFGANQTELTLFLNEPASCKWSKEDKTYNEMENEGICDDSPAEDYFELYECDAKLTNIKDNSNNLFYFRCEDLANNTNQQSYQLNLRGTNPLTISNSRPVGTIFYVNPELKVTTIGGAENGKAVCSYTENNFNFIEFFQSNSNTHIQPLKNLLLGSYNYNVICRDIAGNEANSTISFVVNIDNLAPRIDYLYRDATNLHILTNEAASCEYSINSFSKGNGEKMNGENKDHTLLVSGKNYYILCYDKDGNTSPLTKLVIP